MNENVYSLKDNEGHVIADHMSLETALMFAEAYMNKYFMEPDLHITICRNNNETELNFKEELKNVQ